MAETKVQTGISISEFAMEHLREMAQKDSRTVSGEIEALVNEEWDRRLADRLAERREAQDQQPPAPQVAGRKGKKE